MDDASVPTYKLFGEKEIWPSSDLVHYETIAARSSIYEWKIAPHRHDNLLQILMLEAGDAWITLETVTEPLATPCIALIPPRAIHGFSFSPNLVGHIVTLPHFLIAELLHLAPELRDSLKAAARIALAGDAAGLELLKSQFARFSAEYTSAQPGRACILMALLAEILVWLARAATPDPRDAERDRFRQRIDRFHELIDKHFREWRPISFYANQLGVSPAQLNATCRRKTGRSAQALIHDRLLLEARRLLAYSDLDVTRIGYELGFDDQAYFSRFFARTQGMTPSAFRKFHGAAAAETPAAPA
ncbi:MAG: helix-turn-helix domain-containing protein [Proteobacteria bacterium]|nr:helix-turn-helix domain-containing protein [Pseudomonadota bacterium]